MNLTRLSAALAAGLLSTLVFTGNAGAAVTEENFVSRTTGDLAALCSAAPTDPLYTAAINFCHGFGAGTYGVLASAQQADSRLKMFCAPGNLTRNEAVAAFVAWAGGKPERAALPSVDGVVGFLTETYPCSKAGAAAPTRRTP